MEVGHTHNSWNVYIPSWWLVGQGGEFSRITMSYKPDFWWDWSFDNWHLSLPILTNCDEKDSRIKIFKNPFEGISKPKDFEQKINKIKRASFEGRYIPGLVDVKDRELDWVKRISGTDNVFDYEKSKIKSLSNYPKNELFNHPWFSKK
jgi:hypothetical protein